MIASSEHPRRIGPMLLGLAALGGLALGGALWWNQNYLLSSPADIPLPDLTTANVHVSTFTNQCFEELRRQPRSASAWGKYGEVLMAHEWNAEALQCFAEASRLEPTNMRWPYLSAVLLDRRDPVEAVLKYEQAKRLDPKYAPLYQRLGTTLQRLNRNQDAEAAYRMASQLSPTDPQPLIGLARLASLRKAWQESADLLEQAVKQAPNNREALVELTRTRVVLGTAQSLTREAQAALLSGEKYQPMVDPILESTRTHEAASRMDAMKADAAAAGGDPQKAAEAFVELIKKRPDLARPRLNLATIYMSLGQTPLAMVTLREMVQLFPDDPTGHLMLSYALEASRSPAEARKEVREAIRLKPDYADAHFALGMASEQDGEMDAAIAAYRMAVQSNERHLQARVALGLAFQKQGKLDKAIEELTAAVRLAPGDRVPKSYLEKALAEKS